MVKTINEFLLTCYHPTCYNGANGEYLCICIYICPYIVSETMHSSFDYSMKKINVVQQYHHDHRTNNFWLAVEIYIYIPSAEYINSEAVVAVVLVVCTIYMLRNILGWLTI